MKCSVYFERFMYDPSTAGSARPNMSWKVRTSEKWL